MKRNRLIVALLALCVAMSATSISFSFAWYASSARVYVQSIDIGVVGERELYIATENKSSAYVKELGTRQLKATGLFTPITTCFATNPTGDYPQFYDMSYPWNQSNAPALFDAATYGYYTQEFFLKAEFDCYVGIDVNNTSINPSAKKNAEFAEKCAAIYGEYTQEEYLDRLNDIIRSARVSVLSEEGYMIYDPIGDEETVYFGGPLDNDNDGFYDFYEENGEAYETFYGQIDDRSAIVYDAPSLVDVPRVGEKTAFNAGHRAGVHPINMPATLAHVGTEPRYVKADLDKFEPDWWIPLTSFEPKRIVVSFYIEGWDLASVNAVMGAAFELNLHFKIIRER